MQSQVLGSPEGKSWFWVNYEATRRGQAFQPSCSGPRVRGKVTTTWLHIGHAHQVKN